MPEMLQITGEQKAAIARAMAAHTAPFVAAITVVGDDEWSATGDVASGRAWGTGNFVDLSGKPYVLTNEHVAVARRTHSLAYALPRGDHPDILAFRIINPFQAMPHPVDAAISRIDEEVWRQGHRSAFPVVGLAREYNPVPGERLFIQGFPGEFTKPTSFLPGMHVTPIAFLTEEVALPGNTTEDDKGETYVYDGWDRPVSATPASAGDAGR